jgi:large subunit ribosomal protein L4
MSVKLYNQSGEETGTIELPVSVFGLKWNADLVHQVVTGQAANRRRVTAHTKFRGEVRGGGKKPWRQKGTGRARHGSIRSPIWAGGGVTHGPRTEKNYTQKINKKMAKKALYTMLSAKARDGEIIIVDDFTFPQAKTKIAASFLTALSHHDGLDRLKKGNGVLLALSEKAVTVKRAFRNIPSAGVDEVRNLTAYEVAQYKYILFPKAVVESMAK